MQCGEGIARLRANLIGELQPADHDSVTNDMQNDGTFGPPGIGCTDLGLPGFFQKPGPTDPNLVAGHGGGDANRR